ncbi:hypothetical protein AMECASPLE_020860 [Ameca splendens]|uniref:Uncharacterized protein n=1 Tax=Ameca splendens TaxID=208324 RepID=A0ABV1A9R2_9TELE
MGEERDHPGRARRRTAVEMARAFIPDVSWTPPSGGVPGTSHREEAQDTAQDTLGGLCLSAGLGAPWASPGGDGGGVWEEGSLSVSIESAAPTTWSRIKQKMTITSTSTSWHLPTLLNVPIPGYHCA